MVRQRELMLPCKDGDVATSLSSILLETMSCTHVQSDGEEKACSFTRSVYVQIIRQTKHKELERFVAFNTLLAALAQFASVSGAANENDLYGGEPEHVSKRLYVSLDIAAPHVI